MLNINVKLSTNIKKLTLIMRDELSDYSSIKQKVKKYRLKVYIRQFK